MTSLHNTTPTRRVRAANGIDFAHRRFGNDLGTPLVFINHYRGNLDTFDPAITDVLAADREIVLFDHTGVGGSSGRPRTTLEDMAADTGAFIDALGFRQVDLLGFSMGGEVAQVLVADRPDLVRKLVLVGTGPRSGEGMASMRPATAELFQRQWDPADALWGPIFFSPSAKGRAAADAYLGRIRERQDRDDPVSAAVADAHNTAARAWGSPGQGDDYLARIAQPTLIVNGSDDIVIPTVNSYTMQQTMPDARLVLFPDSNHGSHFEYHDHFTHEVTWFLDNA